MKRTESFTDCDRCKARDIKTSIFISLVIGKLYDPAGGPSSEDTEDFDLCHRCAAYALANLIKQLKMSHEDAKTFAVHLKKGLGK